MNGHYYERRLSKGYVLCISSVVLLASCVNPSSKITSELTRFGIDQNRAQCVGDRLEANLSIGQLQQLGKAARAYGRDDKTPGRLTVSDLVRVSSELPDAKVPIEVGKAALGCGVLSSSGRN